MGLAKKLKQLGERLLPAPLFFGVLETARRIAPSPQHKFETETREKLKLSDSVTEGPFKGMCYLATSYGSAYLPKLLGSYELEITDFTKSVCQINPDVVVDIGSAEGYYAVGAARIASKATVYAYDTSRIARYATVRLAKLNGVESRVNVGGFCDPALLEQTLSQAKTPLVICDCEGYEEVVIDPQTVPSLARTTLVIEVHGAHLQKKLTERLTPTHHLEIREQQDRPFPKAYEGVIDEETWKRACDEGRGSDQNWMLATPL